MMCGQLGRLPPLSEAAATVRSKSAHGARPSLSRFSRLISFGRERFLEVNKKCVFVRVWIGGVCIGEGVDW